MLIGVVQEVTLIREVVVMEIGRMEIITEPMSLEEINFTKGKNYENRDGSNKNNEVNREVSNVNIGTGNNVRSNETSFYANFSVSN